MPSLPSCPVCRASRFRSLDGYERDHLVSCHDCSFVFSSEMPTPEDYARVYGSYDYVSHDADQTGGNVARDVQIAKSLERFRLTNRVLDIAAGSGHLLTAFRGLRWKTHATEFDQRKRDYLEEKGIKTFGGGLLPEVTPASYDVVIFSEVIEHINNPREVLAHIRTLLRPGGALYLTTPNFDSLERRMLKKDWGMICYPEHIAYWTPKSLHRALTNAGLKRESLKTLNISPYRVLQALKKRGIGKSVSEQGLSDAAQRAVNGNPILRLAKSAANVSLNVTRLGSSMQAVYVKG